MHKINTLEEIKNYIEQLESSFTKILIELDLVPDDEDDIWSQKLLQQIIGAKKQYQCIGAMVIIFNSTSKI